MKRLNLLSGYDSATLFDKVWRLASDEINQWSEAFFESDQIDDRLNDVFRRHCPKLPEIDWFGGEESINEKIYPLSSLQRGAKPGASVRVNVLTYQYAFKGEPYLLGCHPGRHIPESPGVCFVNPVAQVFSIEYTGFNKSPRQVLNAHRAYLSDLIACYSDLNGQFDTFGKQLPEFLRETAGKRKQSLDQMRKIRSGIQK